MQYINEFLSSILFKDGSATMQICGVSMYPLLYNGQYVRIRPALPSDLQIGSCCVYIANGNLILHRIIWIFREHVYIAGDANLSIEKINKANIIAVPDSIHTPMVDLIRIAIINILFALFQWSFFLCRVKRHCITTIIKRSKNYEKTIRKAADLL
jgi:hypothetical protein